MPSMHTHKELRIVRETTINFDDNFLNGHEIKLKMKNATTTTTNKAVPIVLKYFLISLLLATPLLILFLSFFQPHKTNFNTSTSTSDLRIRPGYDSYQTYINRQLAKTTNPKLRQIWTTRDWDRKINVFSQFFSDLKRRNLLSNHSRALCVGARVGQEVEALRRIGVNDSIGIDLVPYPPLVVRGDFHSQPFGNETFDFEFSNVFDHALYPDRFVGEIERTLKVGGVCVLHVALARRADKFSANDLFSLKPLVELFRRSEMVVSRSVDGFGLDTEVVFKKKY